MRSVCQKKFPAPWNPSGRPESPLQTSASQAGGLKSISRWSSAANTTGPRPHPIAQPGGMPALLPPQGLQEPERAGIPAGMPSVGARFRGCRCAQSPANRWHPSGMQTYHGNPRRHPCGDANLSREPTLASLRDAMAERGFPPGTRSVSAPKPLPPQNRRGRPALPLL